MWMSHFMLVHFDPGSIKKYLHVGWMDFLNWRSYKSVNSWMLYFIDGSLSCVCFYTQWTGVDFSEQIILIIKFQKQFADALNFYFWAFCVWASSFCVVVSMDFQRSEVCVEIFQMVFNVEVLVEAVVMWRVVCIRIFFGQIKTHVVLT